MPAPPLSLTAERLVLAPLAAGDLADSTASARIAEKLGMRLVEREGAVDRYELRPPA